MILNLFNKYKLFTDCYVSVKKIEKRNGVCSKNYEIDKHILLWDFDNSEFNKIINNLQILQIKYNLPSIYILESSINHYHAYCFTSRDFKEVIHILSDTEYIDIDYLRLGMARGYYTLRYSPKQNKKVTIKAILKSNKKNEMSPLEVTLNEYFTTNI